MPLAQTHILEAMHSNQTGEPGSKPKTPVLEAGGPPKLEALEKKRKKREVLWGSKSGGSSDGSSGTTGTLGASSSKIPDLLAQAILAQNKSSTQPSGSGPAGDDGAGASINSVIQLEVLKELKSIKAATARQTPTQARRTRLPRVSERFEGDFAKGL